MDRLSVCSSQAPSTTTQPFMLSDRLQRVLFPHWFTFTCIVLLSLAILTTLSFLCRPYQRGRLLHGTQPRRMKIAIRTDMETSYPVSALLGGPRLWGHRGNQTIAIIYLEFVVKLSLVFSSFGSTCQAGSCISAWVTEYG